MGPIPPLIFQSLAICPNRTLTSKGERQISAPSMDRYTKLGLPHSSLRESPGRLRRQNLLHDIAAQKEAGVSDSLLGKAMQCPTA